MYHSRKSLFIKNSKHKGDNPDMGKFLARLKQECHDMQTSLNFYYELDDGKKEKIGFLRYEDIARDPLGLGSKIHQFLQIEFTDQVQQLIKDAVAVTGTDNKVCI